MAALIRCNDRNLPDGRPVKITLGEMRATGVRNLLHESMIRTRRAALAQSAERFCLATNAERVCAEITLNQ